MLKFIAGETEEEESEKVERMLANDAEVFAEVEQLWELWNAVGTATNVNKFNVEKGWENLLERGLGDPAKNRKRGGRMLIWLGGVAAVIVTLIAWTFLSERSAGHRFLNTAPRQEEAVTVQDSVLKDGAAEQPVYAKTDAGHQKKITLPDGSNIWLNGGSAIRYMVSRDGKERILHLSGQAFFDIKHNVQSPFVVKTNHATIKVLGTRFDVTAYPKEAFTEAVLTNGSILFTAESSHNLVSRQIVPGQKISLDYLSGKLNITEVDTAFYASWKEGKLLFRDETFKSVAKAMDHKYNVNILFKNTSLEEKRLNGYLEKESLEEALKALQLTLQFKYQVVNDTVLISK